MSSHVPLKLKEKIWNEFVNLRSLLQKKPENLKQKLRIVNGEIILISKETQEKGISGLMRSSY